VNEKGLDISALVVEVEQLRAIANAARRVPFPMKVDPDKGWLKDPPVWYTELLEALDAIDKEL